MRFDIKFLLRLMAIVSVLIWSVTQTTVLAPIIAVFSVGVIGAVVAKRSTLASSVRYSIAAVGFLFGLLWLTAMYEFFTHVEAQPYFEDGFFFDAILAPIVIGVMILLPVSCMLGAAAALSVAWCKAAFQLFVQTFRKADPDDRQESLPS